jgi:hypothetical protein
VDPGPRPLYWPAESAAGMTSRNGEEEVVSAMTPRALGRVVATALVLLAGWTPTGAAAPAADANQVQAEPTRTGKERLGGKGADEQRVDNCKVPLDLRGAKPRPDECRDAAAAGTKR